MIESQAGYSRPPRAGQFQRGKSGNPRGRPRNRSNKLPFDAVLGQMVTIREDGRERRITAAEAFLLQLTKRGLEGCGASARATLAAIDGAKTHRSESDFEELIVRIQFRTFGLCSVVVDYGIGVLLNARSKEGVRLELKPWIVTEALAKLGDRRLSAEEQRTVVRSTRRTEEVHWPEWWEVRL